MDSNEVIHQLTRQNDDLLSTIKDKQNEITALNRQKKLARQLIESLINPRLPYAVYNYSDAVDVIFESEFYREGVKGNG